MTSRLNISVEKITPDVAEILGGLGVPNGADVGDRTESMAQEAVAIFERLAQPRGTTAVVTMAEFDTIYLGEGANDPVTPLADIYPRSHLLTLFAVTVGEALSAKIAELFGADEFALATMVDSAASIGADRSAEVLELALADRRRANDSPSSMRFSPGYCGWHVSGQKKLFAKLQPGNIGLELSPTCLMTPLKSVSGVIALGTKKIFDFADDFPFCTACTTRSCRDRFEALINRTND